jgi:plastocyanin
MEALLEVRLDAPKVRQEPAAAGGDAVAVQGFAFQPETIEVPPGTEVTWTNGDPEAHTVTAEGGEFDSGPIDPGATFATTFDRSGTVAYLRHPPHARDRPSRLTGVVNHGVPRRESAPPSRRAPPRETRR